MIARLTLRLSRPEAAVTHAETDEPGCYLPALKGDRQGDDSGRVTGAWRLPVRRNGTDAVALESDH